MNSGYRFGIHEKNPCVPGGLTHDSVVVLVFMDAHNFGWPTYVNTNQIKRY